VLVPRTSSPADQAGGGGIIKRYSRSRCISTMKVDARARGQSLRADAREDAVDKVNACWQRDEVPVCAFSNANSATWRM